MCMRYVYSFNEGSKEMKSLLGGKGANLAEMTKIGLPVPPGFTITTKACNDYYENNKTIKQEIIDQIEEKLSILEKDLDKIDKTAFVITNEGVGIDGNFKKKI